MTHDVSTPPARFLTPILKAPITSAALLADRVRTEIYARRPAPGTYLFALADLGKQAGFGPSVVREALQQLSATGLVEVRRGPKGGVYAREVGPEVLTRSLGALVSMNAIPREKVIEARLEIEGLCARLAAMHATEGDLIRLSGSLDRTREAGTDSVAVAEENMTFHLAVAEATHNDVIVALTRSVRDVFFEETVHITYQPAALREAFRAHERLVELIRAGDSEDAVRLMRAHVHGFNRYVESSGQMKEQSSE